MTIKKGQPSNLFQYLEQIHEEGRGFCFQSQTLKNGSRFYNLALKTPDFEFHATHIKEIEGQLIGVVYDDIGEELL